jgi:hypothetical protein
MSSFAVLNAKMQGIKPFSQLAGIDEDIQVVANQCWASEIEQRPLVANIVGFCWLWTNISETIKKFLSHSAVKLIPQTALSNCDRGSDSFSHPGSTLQCEWSRESGITKVSAFIWIVSTMHNRSVDRLLLSLSWTSSTIRMIWTKYAM